MRVEPSRQMKVKEGTCQLLEKLMEKTHFSGKLNTFIDYELARLGHGELVDRALYDRAMEEIDRLGQILAGEIRNVRAARLKDDGENEQRKAS